jgi:hypothetical protein
MVMEAAAFTPRLSPKYLEQHGWKKPDNNVPVEFREVATQIPQAFDSVQRPKWVGIKMASDIFPMIIGQLPTYAVNLLYDLSTNKPLIEVQGNDIDRYIPTDSQRRKLDPASILKDKDYANRNPLPRNLMGYTFRGVSAEALGVFKTGLFLPESALKNFFDPDVVTKKDKGAIVTQPAPQFDPNVKPIDETEVKSRYFVEGDNCFISFPTQSGADDPGRMFPHYRMRVNPNYLQIDLRLAEIGDELEVRSKNPEGRYAGRVHLLDQTIEGLEEQLARLKSIREKTTPEAIAAYIKAQDALAVKLKTHPNLFLQGSSPAWDEMVKDLGPSA